MGLLRGVARTAVISGTATAVSNRVSRRQANRWAAQEQEQYQQQEPAPQPESTSGGGDDTVAQLQQLAKLKDQGILTQDEFDAKKKQLLGI